MRLSEIQSLFHWVLATTLAILGVAASFAGKAYDQVGQGLPVVAFGLTVIMGLNLLEIQYAAEKAERLEDMSLHTICTTLDDLRNSSSASSWVAKHEINMAAPDGSATKTYKSTTKKRITQGDGGARTGSFCSSVHSSQHPLPAAREGAITWVRSLPLCNLPRRRAPPAGGLSIKHG